MARSTRKSAPVVVPTTAAKKVRAPRKSATSVVTETPMKACPFLRAIGADVWQFDATTDNFYRDKSTKDGLAVWSKIGERIYNRGYNARRALNAATESASGMKKGTNARKAADVVVAECQAKVDAAAAEGAFKYGRVARTHGSAIAA